MVPSAAHNDKSQQVFLHVKVSTNIDIVIQQDDAPSVVSTKSDNDLRAKDLQGPSR